MLPYVMRYFAVISYILLILLVNVGYAYLPVMHFSMGEISLADFLVGSIYIARDFAQREIGHKVILAMLIGAAMSFWLADPVIAKASVIAFGVAEIIDWLIFTWTRKPLSQRLLWSAGLSAPLDTVIFLYVAGFLNGLEWAVMTLVKFLGVLALWLIWRRRYREGAGFRQRSSASINFLP